MKNQTVYRGFSQGHSFGLLCAGEMFKEGVIADTVMTKYPFYCMVLILQGKGVYEDDRGHKCNIMPGSIIQRFPDRKHSVRIDPRSRWHELFAGFGLLEFDDPSRQKDRAGGDFWKADIMYPQCNLTMDYLKRLFVIDPSSPVYSSSGLFRPQKDFIEFREKLERASVSAVPRLIGDGLGLFSRMGQGRLEIESPGSDPLIQTRDLLESRLGERIPLTELLNPISLSYAHLREKFRDITGVSPGQYRIARRIEKACYYLTAEHLSPGETALRLGYEDTSSFSRQFKKIMSLSPGEYSRSHRKD